MMTFDTGQKTAYFGGLSVSIYPQLAQAKAAQVPQVDLMMWINKPVLMDGVYMFTTGDLCSVLGLSAVLIRLALDVFKFFRGK